MGLAAGTSRPQLMEREGSDDDLAAPEDSRE